MRWAVATSLGCVLLVGCGPPQPGATAADVDGGPTEAEPAAATAPPAASVPKPAAHVARVLRLGEAAASDLPPALEAAGFSPPSPASAPAVPAATPAASSTPPAPAPAAPAASAPANAAFPSDEASASARAPAPASTGTPVAAPAPAPAASGSTPPLGQVSDAAKKVAAMRADFRTCYQRELKVNRWAQGSVRLTMRVGPEGQVLEVRGISPSLRAEVVDCMLLRVVQTVFSAPEGGSAVIAVPVTFVKQ